MEPWDKRGAETPGAFKAFQLYRDMGADRTMLKVSKIVGKHVTQLRQWSAKHDWVARCHSWDVHLDRELQQQAEKDQRDMLVRHGKAMMALQELALKAMKVIQPEDMTTSDVVRYLTAGVAGERQARGVGLEGEDKSKAAYLALWERLGGEAPTGTDG